MFLISRTWNCAPLQPVWALKASYTQRRNMADCADPAEEEKNTFLTHFLFTLCAGRTTVEFSMNTRPRPLMWRSWHGTRMQAHCRLPPPKEAILPRWQPICLLKYETCCGRIFGADGPATYVRLTASVQSFCETTKLLAKKEYANQGEYHQSVLQFWLIQTYLHGLFHKFNILAAVNYSILFQCNDSDITIKLFWPSCTAS